MDQNLFRNPPKTYQEVPFWSLNDDLDPEELVRQIGLMDEAGWGGFFMHSRIGLKTPYMGPRWMECLKACVDEARKRGMEAWIYDEDQWPSGFAGGLSVTANPDYRSHYLVCKVDNRLALLTERIATFVAREVEGVLVDFRAEEKPTFLQNDERIVQFYPMTMPLSQEWFNDYAYLDLMNPDAVKAFLASTHQVYADTFAEDMGKTIPGVFTDEPCYIFRFPSERPNYLYLPWTIGFAELFQAVNGYDLLPHLPALFFPGIENSPAYRYDFFHTAQHRFIESYTVQVSEWCEKNHVAYTGHYMAEDSLFQQVFWTGGAMAEYPHMHIPGIDKLARSINEGCGTILTVKQLDSVVCQTGKPRALCENYGVAGADFAHTGRKWIGDWAYMLRNHPQQPPPLPLLVTRRTQTRFSPEYFLPAALVARKPADRRLLCPLELPAQPGQAVVVDVLIIHPLGSGWAVYQPRGTEVIDELDQKLDQLQITLMQHQRDYHLADEDLMALGGATEGKVIRTEDGPRLQVGKMAYRLVIIPSGVTLAKNTVRLLQEFSDAGGTLISIPPAPTLIDAPPHSIPGPPHKNSFLRLSSPSGRPRPIPALRCPGLRAAQLLGPAPHHRRGRLLLPGQYRPGSRLHGQSKIPPSRPSRILGSRYRPNSTLPFRSPGRHHLHHPRVRPGRVLPPGPSPRPRPFPPPCFTTRQVVYENPLGPDWDLSLDGLNSITLDTFQLKIGPGDWTNPLYIMDIPPLLLLKGTGTTFSLRTRVEVSEELSLPLYLVVESPEQFKISVNGHGIDSKDCGWWVDISFRKIDVSHLIRVGKNEIVLEGSLRRDTELESIYLIGNFGGPVQANRIRKSDRRTGFRPLFLRFQPGLRSQKGHGLPFERWPGPRPDPLRAPFLRRTAKNQPDPPSAGY